jgi:hypothetical protein
MTWLRRVIRWLTSPVGSTEPRTDLSAWSKRCICHEHKPECDCVPDFSSYSMKRNKL